MKKEILKKMKAYSAAAGAVVAVGTSADAQVNWSGPINELVTSSFNIDLDGDAVNDFVIALTQSGSYKSANLSPVATGNQWLSTALYNNYVKALPVDANVSVSATPWGSDTFPWNMGWLSSGSNYPGNFIGAGDQFIGVKFDISGAFHYGWIRVNVAGDALSLTVIDWAYDETANAGITTGDNGGIPTLSGISSANIALTSADILFTPDVNGTAYLVVLDEADSAPTAAEVVAGTGSGGAGAVFAGNLAVTGATQATFNATGLSSGTAYTGYLVLDDGITKTLSYVYEIDFSSAVGIQDLSNFINVFPNPTKGMLQIDFDASDYEFKIRDITGKTLFEGKNTKNVDLSEFGSGTYFIQIQTENGVLNRKIIVQ
jgi:hypothetical protein